MAYFGDKNIIEPSPVLVSGGRFIIKIASNDEELRQAFKLRYEVFKIEQGRLGNIKESLDFDKFDQCCMHLLVIETQSNQVVGTYRMQSGIRSREHFGFYSEQEFQLSNIDHICQEIFEVGRSCVHPEYRSGAVVALLWAGIVIIKKRANFNYMLGCVSLEHTDEVVGWSLYDYFVRQNLMTDGISAEPKSAYCLPSSAERIADDEKIVRMLPPLFKGYLRIGAKICGKPALDRDFGSIDFLIWFDFDKLPEKYVKHFKV